MLDCVEVTEVLSFWSMHGMKVIERIFERQLKNVVRIDEMQMGLMPGRITIDAIFILRQMLEKSWKWQEGNYTWYLLI